MKKLLKEIKEWKHGCLKYLVYSYRLTIWLYLNRCRRLVVFFKKHFDLIRQVTFVLVAIIIGYIVNRFSGNNFTQDILSNYLVSAGVMAGGTMAIVFTISIFLLQNASDLYSSQYLEVYIHDWKEKFVYFTVIIITIILFGGGLFIGSLSSITQEMSSFVVFWSLVFVGVVFALIDWQYKNVRQKINPSKSILFLEKEGTRFLKRLQYDAGRMAGIIQAKDDSVTNEMALATAYNRFLQPFISNIDRQLENLVEISIKLADKQEIGTTKRGFTAIYNILERFFEARKSSSIAVPSGIALLARESDSQTFLTHNFERLNKAGEKFIKEGKDEIATYIIDVYRALAIKSQDINFVGQRNENPILEHLVGYLNYFIENGQRAKNIEVVYQGSRVLSDIAVIAARKGYGPILHGLQEKIFKIAIFGLQEKQGVIVDSCTSAYLRIIGSVFDSTKIVRRHYYNDALKNIATISNYMNTFIGAGLYPGGITSSFSLSKGYDELYTLITVIMSRYSVFTEDEKNNCRGDIVEFFHEVNSSLRKLSEDLKNCDSTLIDSIGRLLFNINNLIIDLINNEEFKGERVELIKRLGWNMHLPYWFVYYSEKFDGGSNHFNELVDSVAKTGILVAEKIKDKELVKDCISCLYSITEEALKKTTSGYGYDEPRILEKACYLGILALRNKWDEVFIDVGLKIYDFEPKYYQKYLTNLPPKIDPENHNVIGLPHKDQLFRELLRWRDNFQHELWNGNLRLREDSEAIMYSVIQPIDIDRFMFEVWKMFPSDSKIEDELENNAKRRQIKKIISILERRVLELS